MHHEPLKPAPLQPAATEVNRTTDYTVASVDSHASSGDDSRRESWCRNRKIDRFDSSSINHKALETLAMARSRRPYTQVNLLLLLLQEQGDYLASTPETRYTTCERHSSFARQTGRSTSCAFAFHTTTTPTTTCQPERNDE